MTLISGEPGDDIDYRQAAKTLDAWLAEMKYNARVEGWTRWCYSSRPFWSAWVEVYDATLKHFTIGVHVYDDGEVAVVTTNEGGNENVED